MPIRNPFARRQADDGGAGSRPTLALESALLASSGFERVDTVGSKASSIISISSRRSGDTGEYKMSVVNDSGVYLPDVSARSPIVNPTDSCSTRRSTDSARFPRMHRQRLFDLEPPTAVQEGDGEGGFEDVGLNDDARKEAEAVEELQVPPPPQPKKKGFFAKFTDHVTQDSGGGTSLVASASLTSTRFSLLPSRKRGQSGQGAELDLVEPPHTANRETGGPETADVPA